MSNARPRKRRVDQKGRNKHHPYVKLDHYFLKSMAWKSLKPPARAIYVELSRRFNGHNNGEISLSAREAGAAVLVSKDTANLHLRILEDRGFIKSNVRGNFNWKLGHATTWVLTEKPLNDLSPTNDFMSWKPPTENPGPNGGTDCRCSGTGCVDRGRVVLLPVLLFGPSAFTTTVARSDDRDTYNIPWGEDY